MARPPQIDWKVRRPGPPIVVHTDVQQPKPKVEWTQEYLEGAKEDSGTGVPKRRRKKDIVWKDDPKTREESTFAPAEPLHRPQWTQPQSQKTATDFSKIPHRIKSTIYPNLVSDVIKNFARGKMYATKFGLKWNSREYTLYPLPDLIVCIQQEATCPEGTIAVFAGSMRCEEKNWNDETYTYDVVRSIKYLFVVNGILAIVHDVSILEEA
jgi:hypothetical protein